MGRLLKSLEAAADAAERLARAGGDFNSATQASGVATPPPAGQTVFNIFPTKGASSPGGRIGGGSSGGTETFFGSEIDDFERFLLARGITQKYLLENEAFMAALRAQFEKLRADLLAGGFDTLLRSGGG